MIFHRLRFVVTSLLILLMTFSSSLGAGAAGSTAGTDLRVANSPQAVSADHLVSQITLAPRSPNILLFNQNITVSFSYQTTEASGVRIFVRPFTGTSLTPNYAACGSPLYAVGSGTGSCTITITGGATTVNSLRFQIWNDSQSTLLFETFIPVNYQFKGNASLVRSLALAPATPNIMLFGQKVTVRFAYRTNQAGGVRIFARPMTGTSLTPNYAACPSPIYPAGSGTGSCTFTISSGAVTVNKIRFEMWNANQTVLLFRAFVPVSYQFRGDRTLVRSISLAPATPNILLFNQNVTVNFSYRTSVAGGVRIFARPMTGASLTPNYGACPSPIYPAGSGTGSCTFTILDGTATVNRIRFEVWNDAQTVLLFTKFIPVHYQFR